MAFRTHTLQRSLNKRLGGSTPLPFPPGEEAAFIAALKARLGSGGRVLVATGNRAWPEKAERLVFSLEVKTTHSSRYSYEESISVSFFVRAEHTLWLRVNAWSREEPTPVPSPEAILGIAEELRQAVERHEAQQRKGEKVRGLKTQAILAQVRAFALEDGFTWHAEADSIKLKLYVVLGEDVVELHVPFSSFAETTPRLRETIRSLQALLDGGVRFQLRSKSFARYRAFQWTSSKT